MVRVRHGCAHGRGDLRWDPGRGFGQLKTREHFSNAVRMTFTGVPIQRFRSASLTATECASLPGYLFRQHGHEAPGALAPVGLRHAFERLLDVQPAARPCEAGRERASAPGGSRPGAAGAAGGQSSRFTQSTYLRVRAQ